MEQLKAMLGQNFVIKVSLNNKYFCGFIHLIEIKAILLNRAVENYHNGPNHALLEILEIIDSI